MFKKRRFVKIDSKILPSVISTRLTPQKNMFFIRSISSNRPPILLLFMIFNSHFSMNTHYYITKLSKSKVFILKKSTLMALNSNCQKNYVALQVK
jgi:hypothetical protein